MSDFHLERNLNGVGWSATVSLPQRTYLDTAAPCGVRSYRVRAHWHGQAVYSDYSNVTSGRTCIPQAPDGLTVVPLGPG